MTKTVLRNCIVQIEPKGHPEDNRIFYSAEITLDEMGLYRSSEFELANGVDVPITMKVYPSPHIHDTQRNIALIGDSKADSDQAKRLEIIRTRLRNSDKLIRELGRKHIEVFAMAGDLLELIMMLEGKTGG